MSLLIPAGGTTLAAARRTVHGGQDLLREPVHTRVDQLANRTIEL